MPVIFIQALSLGPIRHCIEEQAAHERFFAIVDVELPVRESPSGCASTAPEFFGSRDCGVIWNEAVLSTRTWFLRREAMVVSVRLDHELFQPHTLWLAEKGGGLGLIWNARFLLARYGDICCVALQVQKLPNGKLVV